MALQIIFFLFAMLSVTVSAQQLPSRIILDRETFSPTQYVALQQLANEVTTTVDQLIPGRLSEFVIGDIICFQLTAKALIGVDAQFLPPITISTDYKLFYEPTSTVAARTRIALFEVEPLYAPSYRERFVYQLSHELAHVKMGVRMDNYLVETLATTISHEVLVRLGMISYANLEFNAQMRHLPDEIQRAYVAGNVFALQNYWQHRASLEGLMIEDRPFQTLGAALIRLKFVPWSALLGIAFATDCPLDNPPTNSTLCTPNISKMMMIKPILTSLGYRWDGPK